MISNPGNANISITFKWIKVYVNIPWNGYQSNFLQIIITYIDQIVQTISLHL